MARKSKASPESESQSREIVWEGSEDLKPLLVPIGSVHADPANVRRHPERNVEAIRSSLARFGQQKPIVVDAKGVVRAGNGTLDAARSLGWSHVARVVTALEGSEATAFAIADNRSSDLATWDVEALVAQLQALEHDGIEPASLGWDDAEVANLVDGLGGDAGGGGDPAEAPEPQSDRADELLATWKVRAGQVWEIPSKFAPGKCHRLLCGDSTKPEDVARVMAGVKAGIMNTDPPYGIAYSDEMRVAAERAHGRPRRAEKWSGGIDNDGVDGEKLQAFLESAIRAAVPHLVDNAAFYLWHPMLTQGTFFAAAAAAAADILIHRQIIWVKPGLLFGFGDYHWQHELCFYGWRKGHRPEFYGERNQTTVWDLRHDTPSSERAHPTQKPVELFARPMLNHTRPGGVVYEPFAGSGSQFVAAEQSGRICLGLELAPKYVAVALQRLADMGLEPRLAR